MTPRERLAPYVEDIARACDEAGQDPFVFAGLILRESGAGWAPGYEPKGKPDGWGDHGYGFGLCQLDRRWHSGFVKSADAARPLAQFRYACSILLHDRRSFQHSAASFSDPDYLLRCTLAAYNAGWGRVYHCAVLNNDPDSVTTGGDYARDVISRAECLRGEFPRLFDALSEPPARVA